MGNPTLITISGESHEEIKEKLKMLAKAFGIEVVGDTQMSLPLTPKTAEKPVGEEPKTRGRKPKTEPKESAAEEKVTKSESVPTTETSPVVETPIATTGNTVPETTVPAPSLETSTVVTQEAAMAALKDLSGKKGFPAARDILLKHKANRFSELKKENYGAFIESCKAAVAS